MRIKTNKRMWLVSWKRANAIGLTYVAGETKEQARSTFYMFDPHAIILEVTAIHTYMEDAADAPEV